MSYLAVLGRLQASKWDIQWIHSGTYNETPPGNESNRCTNLCGTASVTSLGIKLNSDFPVKTNVSIYSDISSIVTSYNNNKDGYNGEMDTSSYGMKIVPTAHRICDNRGTFIYKVIGTYNGNMERQSCISRTSINTHGAVVGTDDGYGSTYTTATTDNRQRRCIIYTGTSTNCHTTGFSLNTYGAAVGAAVGYGLSHNQKVVQKDISTEDKHGATNTPHRPAYNFDMGHGISSVDMSFCTTF